MACTAMVSPVAERFHHHHHHHHQQQQQQQMRITEQVMNCKLKEKKQLPFENYLDFLLSYDFSNFTVNQLSQIVSIHGFQEARSTEAEEAVIAIESIDPARSTLSEDISSSINAIIDFNEAIKDLKALNWQECSITTIKSIKPENDKTVLVSPPTTSTKSKSLKAAKKPELASLMSTGSGPNNSCSSGSYSVVPVFPSTTATKMRKTIKRRKLASLTASSCSGPSNDDNSGLGGCSSSSFVARGKSGGGKKMLHAIVCLGAS